jgi:hypothetical protein
MSIALPSQSQSYLGPITDTSRWENFQHPGAYQRLFVGQCEWFAFSYPHRIAIPAFSHCIVKSRFHADPT